MKKPHRPGTRWQLLLAVASMLYLPLRAAEAPAPDAPAPPASAEAPAGNTRPAETAQPVEKEGQSPKPAEADEEQVSLDSNLSFPVDI